MSCVIGAALACTPWLRGVGRIPVSAVAFLPLISPLVAAALGWAVLGQSLTARRAPGPPSRCSPSPAPSKPPRA